MIFFAQPQAESPAGAAVGTKDVMAVAAIQVFVLFLFGRFVLESARFLGGFHPGQETARLILTLLSISMDMATAGVAVWVVGRLRVLPEFLHTRRCFHGLAIGAAIGVASKFLFKWGTDGFFVFWPHLARNPYDSFSNILFAPVVESIVYCGSFYGAMRRTRGVAFSLTVSAAIFSLTHLALNFPDLVGAPSYIAGQAFGLLQAKFIMGLAFGAAYAATGSIAGPIVAHAIYNL